LLGKKGYTFTSEGFYYNTGNIFSGGKGYIKYDDIVKVDEDIPGIKITMRNNVSSIKLDYHIIPKHFKSFLEEARNAVKI
jgi:hypothetical protein